MQIIHYVAANLPKISGLDAYGLAHNKKPLKILCLPADNLFHPVQLGGHVERGLFGNGLDSHDSGQPPPQESRRHHSGNQGKQLMGQKSQTANEDPSNPRVENWQMSPQPDRNNISPTPSNAGYNSTTSRQLGAPDQHDSNIKYQFRSLRPILPKPKRS
ncbi:hypothetical protein AJ78_08544 [Emergomyces pasteurianus Ep9510]|uniref:Uncharacterized protein n=1 Tax=Emergomyces pasteurianus Ep9510 TaxID=1447872 RepID=A0A1J9Q3F3_9EURO|nr:hypothetical protein AJ78_08544 [Emergomyces pasteurianus Ep9510]